MTLSEMVKNSLICNEKVSIHTHSLLNIVLSVQYKGEIQLFLFHTHTQPPLVSLLQIKYEHYHSNNNNTRLLENGQHYEITLPKIFRILACKTQS